MLLSRSDFGANPHAGVSRNNARARGWGSGWPNCQSAKMGVAKAPGGARAWVRHELVPLVEVLFAITEMHGYKLKVTATGGFACRPIRGTRQASNHSFGTAVDLNWGDNPMQSTFKTNIPPHVVHAWEACGFYWGGRYMNRPDAMHMEFVFSPADAGMFHAKAVALLEVLETGRALVVVVYEPRSEAKPGKRTLSLGVVGADVEFVQRFLGIAVNARYGPVTSGAVRKYQKMRGLRADGVVGPSTWIHLLSAVE